MSCENYYHDLIPDSATFNLMEFKLNFQTIAVLWIIQILQHTLRISDID